MMRWIPLLAFAAIMVGLWIGLYRDGRDALPSTLIAEPARAFSLPSLLEEGDTFDLGTMKGSGPVVLNFWASWCPPCIAEHPEITRLSKLDDVQVYGINHQDKKDRALSFLKRHGNPFTAIGYDEKGRTALDYGITKLPESFVIAADGTVLYKHVGPINPGDFEDKFLPALEAARAR